MQTRSHLSVLVHDQAKKYGNREYYFSRKLKEVAKLNAEGMDIGEVVNGIHVVNQRQEVLDKRFLVFYYSLNT